MSTATDLQEYEGEEMSDDFSEPISKASMTSLLANLASALITGSVFILLVSIAVPEQLGLYTGVVVLGEMGVLIGVFGMNEAATWRLAQFSVTKNPNRMLPIIRGFLLVSLGISAIVSCSIFFMSEGLSDLLFGSTSNIILPRLLALGILFHSLGTTSFGLLMGLHRIRVLSAISFITVAAGQVLGILLFIQGFDVPGLASGWVLGGLVSLSAIGLVGIPLIRSSGISLPDLQTMRFSASIFAGHILLFLTRALDRYLLLLFVPLYWVGIYSVPSILWMLATYLPLSLYVSLIPKLSRTFECGDEAEFSNLLRTGFTIMLMVLIVVSGFAIPLSPWVLRLIGGSEYLVGALPFQILCLGIPIYGASLLLTGTLKAQGRASTAAICLLAGVLTSATVGLTCIPTTGILGAALSNTIGQIAALITSVYFVRKHSANYLDSRRVSYLILALAPSFVLLSVSTWLWINSIWHNLMVGVAIVVALILVRAGRIVPEEWSVHIEQILPSSLARVVTRVLIGTRPVEDS